MGFWALNLKKKNYWLIHFLFIGWNLHHLHVQDSVGDLGAYHFIPRSKTNAPREAGIIIELKIIEFIGGGTGL